jgi:hypothetical protein
VIEPPHGAVAAGQERAMPHAEAAWLTALVIPAKAGGIRQAPVAVACTQPDVADSQTPLASVPRTW